MSDSWAEILLASPPSKASKPMGAYDADDKLRNASISSSSTGSAAIKSSQMSSVVSTPSSASTMSIPAMDQYRPKKRPIAVQVAIPRSLELQKGTRCGKFVEGDNKNGSIESKMARFAPRSSGKLGYVNTPGTAGHIEQDDGLVREGQGVQRRKKLQSKRSGEDGGSLSAPVPGTYTRQSRENDSVRTTTDRNSTISSTNTNISSKPTDTKLKTMAGQKTHGSSVAIPKGKFTQQATAITTSNATSEKQQQRASTSCWAKPLSFPGKNSSPISASSEVQAMPVRKRETSGEPSKAGPNEKAPTATVTSSPQPKRTKQNRRKGQGNKQTPASSNTAKHEAILAEAWGLPQPAATEDSIVRSSNSAHKTTAKGRRSRLYFLPDEILTMILRHCLESPLESGIPVDPMFDPSPAHSRCKLDYRVIHTCRRFYDLGIALMYEINTWAVDLRPFMECPKLYEPWPLGYGIDIGMRHIRNLVLMNDEDGTGQWHCSIQCLQGFIKYGGLELHNGKQVKLQRLTFDARNRAHRSIQGWVVKPAPQRVMATLKEAGLLGNGMFPEGVWVAAGSVQDMERQAALPNGGFGGLCVQLEESLGLWRELQSKPIIPLEKMLTSPMVSA